MVAYGLFTSRKEQNRQRYRSDKLYRGTFLIVVIVLVAQVFAVAAASVLWMAERRIDPESGLSNHVLPGWGEEEQHAPLFRKLGILNSLKPLIVNRTPATRLINNIEEAFFANERVGLIDSSSPIVSIPMTQTAKTISPSWLPVPSRPPARILGLPDGFHENLGGKVPKGANVEIARNAVDQGEEAFAPFDLKIHYASP